MVLLTAFIEVLPKDREAIHSALADVITSTRAEEGCEEYGCYEDTQRPGCYVFVEDAPIGTSRHPTWRLG